MLLYGELPCEDSKDVGIIRSETVRGIMGILESSETVRCAESLRRSPRYTIPQLFTVDLIRDAGRIPYSKVADALTDEICATMDLPQRNGEYRIPSAGRLNAFILEEWPGYSRGFGSELASTVIERELGRDGTAVLTLGSIPLEASESNLDARRDVHYAKRMDRAHIAAINGLPLFCIHTEGTRNECAEAGNLCRMLRSTGKLWERDAEFVMDAGCCTFECLAEAFLVTGSRPHAVLRSDSVIHPRADWNGIRAQYGRMFRFPDYDPFRKDDERFVLRFLCRHGMGTLVGQYLQNCEIRRQGGGAAMRGRKDAGNFACRMIRNGLNGRIPFDIRGINHETRASVIAFRFNAIQILSALSADDVPGTDRRCPGGPTGYQDRGIQSRLREGLRSARRPPASLVDDGMREWIGGGRFFMPSLSSSTLPPRTPPGPCPKAGSRTPPR